MPTASLERVASGDSTAIRQCIETHGSLVWGLARRLSRSSADAEDATQEIFLDIWRCAHRFDPGRGSERAFIATIARRRLVDRIRKIAQEPPHDPLDGLEVVDVAEQRSSESSLDAERATHALAALQPKYRTVLELSILHDKTHVEIAAELLMPLGTVKCFIKRGLVQLRSIASQKARPARISNPFPMRSDRLASTFLKVAVELPGIRIAPVAPTDA